MIVQYSDSEYYMKHVVDIKLVLLAFHSEEKQLYRSS